MNKRGNYLCHRRNNGYREFGMYSYKQIYARVYRRWGARGIIWIHSVNSRVILNHLGESTSTSSILLSTHVNIMLSNDGGVEHERRRGSQQEKSTKYFFHRLMHMFLSNKNIIWGYWISYSRPECSILPSYQQKFNGFA